MSRPPAPSLSRSLGRLLWFVLSIGTHLIVSGLLVRYMYHRLLVPTFPALPHPITVAAALGIVIVARALTMDLYTATTDRSIGEREGIFVVFIATNLFLTWVVGCWL